MPPGIAQPLHQPLYTITQVAGLVNPLLLHSNASSCSTCREELQSWKRLFQKRTRLHIKQKTNSTLYIHFLGPQITTADNDRSKKTVTEGNGLFKMFVCLLSPVVILLQKSKTENAQNSQPPVSSNDNNDIHKIKFEYPR